MMRSASAQSGAALLVGMLGWLSVPAAASSQTVMPPDQRSLERPAGLEATAWKLVRIEYGDETTAVPDDPEKYTIEFMADGRVMVNADCTVGRGAYTTDGPRLSLTVIAYARTTCPPGSLFDKYRTGLEAVSSYVLEGGQLHLAMKLDTGIMTFEPIAPSAAAR